MGCACCSLVLALLCRRWHSKRSLLVSLALSRHPDPCAASLHVCPQTLTGPDLAGWAGLVPRPPGASVFDLNTSRTLCAWQVECQPNNAAPLLRDEKARREWVEHELDMSGQVLNPPSNSLSGL